MILKMNHSMNINKISKAKQERNFLSKDKEKKRILKDNSHLNTVKIQKIHKICKIHKIKMLNKQMKVKT